MGTQSDNRSEQSVEGLTVRKAGDVILVNDGDDTWLCRAEEWMHAHSTLRELPIVDDDPDESGCCAAYNELCQQVAPPIASVIGHSRGDYPALVRDAVAAGLLDADDARRMYNVEVT